MLMRKFNALYQLYRAYTLLIEDLQLAFCLFFPKLATWYVSGLTWYRLVLAHQKKKLRAIMQGNVHKTKSDSSSTKQERTKRFFAYRSSPWQQRMNWGRPGMNLPRSWASALRYARLHGRLICCSQVLLSWRKKTMYNSIPTQISVLAKVDHITRNITQSVKLNTYRIESGSDKLVYIRT